MGCIKSEMGTKLSLAAGNKEITETAGDDIRQRF